MKQHTSTTLLEHRHIKNLIRTTQEAHQTYNNGHIINPTTNPLPLPPPPPRAPLPPTLHPRQSLAHPANNPLTILILAIRGRGSYRAICSIPEGAENIHDAD